MHYLTIYSSQTQLMKTQRGKSHIEESMYMSRPLPIHAICRPIRVTTSSAYEYYVLVDIPSTTLRTKTGICPLQLSGSFMDHQI